MNKLAKLSILTAETIEAPKPTRNRWPDLTTTLSTDLSHGPIEVMTQANEAELGLLTYEDRLAAWERIVHGFAAASAGLIFSGEEVQKSYGLELILNLGEVPLDVQK